MVAAGTPAPTVPTHDESTDSRDNYTILFKCPLPPAIINPLFKSDRRPFYFIISATVPFS